MSMLECAQRATVPPPEQGLKCPRSDSTNTKFCYLNNYSLTQPRHFCRACRRSWTRSGALRRAKRSARPKAAMGTEGGVSSGRSVAPSSATTCTGSATAPCSEPVPPRPGMDGSDSLCMVSSEISLE